MSVPVPTSRLDKPRVLVRGVAGHKIQADLQSFGMSLVNEPYQIRVRAETRVYLIVVGDVIAAVLELAAEHRADPDCVESQILDIIQFRADSLQITIAVAIAVLERGRVDVIDSSRVKPLRIGLRAKISVQTEAFPVVAGSSAHSHRDQFLDKLTIPDRDSVALYRDSFGMAVIHKLLCHIRGFRSDHQILDLGAAGVDHLLVEPALHKLQRGVSHRRCRKDVVPPE